MYRVVIHGGNYTSEKSQSQEEVSYTHVDYDTNLNTGRWRIKRKRDDFLHQISEHPIDEQFFSFAKKWKKETSMSSVVYDKITNPYYMLIIGMGITYKDVIIKLILKDLQEGEEFWHYALKSITNENPVPKGMVNDLSIVREKWLVWGKDNNKI